jgi:hypothetical protein
LVYVFLRICLLLEATGLCAGAWVLAYIQKKILHYQRDEVYIGTAEERAAKHMGDDVSNLHTGPGHLYKLPGFYEDAPESLQELMKIDPSVREFMASLHEMKGEDHTERDVESGDDGADLKLQDHHDDHEVASSFSA